MSLRQHQESFLQDVSKLIVFIFSSGFTATGGELLRPDDMQKLYYETGRSNIKSGGYHQIKLAIDLNIFKEGVYLDKKRRYFRIWQSNKFKLSSIYPNIR